MIHLREPQEGDEFTFADWQAIVTALRRTQMTVAPPLGMTNSGEGMLITLESNFDEVYFIKPTDNCSSGGGGKYIADGYRVDPPDLVCSADDLALPEGLTTDDSEECLVINTEESGLTTHWLDTTHDKWTIGIRRGSDDEGRPIIMVNGGYYRYTSPSTFGEAGMKDGFGEADPNSWDRDTSDTPLAIYDFVGFREYPGSPGNCNADPPKLYGYKRLKTYDAGGRLKSTGAEAEFLIATGCCAPAYSISSPTFASESEAAAASMMINRIAISSL